MAVDPNFAKVALLVGGPDAVAGVTAIRDYSARQKPLLANGDAAMSNAVPLFGANTIAFDGTGDYVSTPAHADFAISGDFTAEAWVYQTSRTGGGAVFGGVTYQSILDNAQTGSSGNSGLSLYLADGKPAVNVYQSNVNKSVFAANAIPLSAWTHIAAEKVGGTLTLYVNGASVGTLAVSGAFDTSTRPLCIGSDGTGNGRFVGYVGMVRMYNGVSVYKAAFALPADFPPKGYALVAGSVKDSGGQPASRLVRAYRRSDGTLLNESFSSTPDPYFGSVVLLLHGDGVDGSVVFPDKSSATKTISVFGNAKVSSAQVKFGNASMYFDGVGDYVRSPQSADFQLFAGDSTIEFFAYYGSSAGNQAMMQLDSASSGNRANLSLVAGALILYTEVGQSAGARISVAAAPSVNAWHHIALVRSGSTTTLFVDGVNVGSTTTTVLPTGNLYLSFGSTRSSGGVEDYAGYLAEVRVTKGVARYTANFVPPTERFSDRAIGALGGFSFYAWTADELNLICLDDAAGTVQNDKVLRVQPA